MNNIVDNITSLPPQEFLAICAGWKDDMVTEGKWAAIQVHIDEYVLRCPVHAYAAARGLCHRTVGGKKHCPICGHYMCPQCDSHAVDIMSRVTGYLQVVSGWNVAKKQEFKDRKRYKLS